MQCTYLSSKYIAGKTDEILTKKKSNHLQCLKSYVEFRFLEKMKLSLKSYGLLCLMLWNMQIRSAESVTLSESECLKLGLLEQAKLTLDSYAELYRKYLENLDIYMIPPDGFVMSGGKIASPVLLCTNSHFKPSGVNGYIGSLYTPPYRNADKDAVLLYPLIIEVEDVVIEEKARIELIAANSNDDFDCTDLIRHIDDTANLRQTNADEVYMFEYNLPDPFEGEYRHCIGLWLRKDNHYAVQIKLLLNDEGEKKKNEYIQKVLKSIRFGNFSL